MKKPWLISLLAALLCFFGNTVAHAQSYTDDYYTRKINLRVLRAMDEYELISTFSHARFYEAFDDLFINKGVKIPVDALQMGLLDKEVILDKYTPLNRDNWSPEQYGLDVEMVVDDIGPLNKDVWQKSRHQGTIVVRATKIIAGLAHPDCKCNKPFTDSIPLVFIYHFDFENDQYLIQDINWVGKIGRRVVLTMDSRDLLCHSAASKVPIEMRFPDGRLIRDTTDSTGTLLVQRMAPGLIPKIIVTNPKFEGKVSGILLHHTQDGTDESVPQRFCGNHDTLEVNLRLPMIALELESGFLLPGQSMVKSGRDALDAQLSNASHYSAGFRAGVYLHYGQGGYWLMKTGLGWESYQYKLKVDSVETTYNATDPFDVRHIRTSLITNIQETRKLGYLSIPIAIEQGFHLPMRLKAFVCAVGRVLLPIVRHSESSASALYSGMYPDLYNINIRENGVYNFGAYAMNSQSKLNATKPLIVAELGAGLRKMIVKRVDIGIGLRYNWSVNYLLQKNSTSITLSRTAGELNNLGVVEYRDRLSYLSFVAGILFKI